jgi:sodium-dependent dicarboxylate transporter 2/3/5
MVPLAIGLALATGRPPHVLALAAGLSASFAFLLPANSAPNALAYGTGMFKARDMLRAGAVLMLAGVVVVTVCAVVVWPRLEWLL